MYEFMLHLYVTSVGFVAAGVIASFSKMVTGHPMSFVIPRPINVFLAIIAVMARVFAGPFLLMRNSLRGLFIERRAVHWIVMSFFIAAVWSFFSGLFMIEMILRMQS